MEKDNTSLRPKHRPFRTWEKGNQNEIDIVAVNSLHKVVDFYEIKKRKSAIRISHLEKKAEKIMQKLEGFTFGFYGLSMEDM